MNEHLAYSMIAGIVILFLMMARILQWWLRSSSVRTVKFALKLNFIILTKYTSAILLLGIIIEINDVGTTDERGWPDLVPEICVILWGLLFLIQLLVLWCNAEINLWIQFLKNKKV